MNVELNPYWRSSMHVEASPVGKNWSLIEDLRWLNKKTLWFTLSGLRQISRSVCNIRKALLYNHHIQHQSVVQTIKTYVCMYVCMYVSMYVCVCMIICIYIYIYMYVWLYMYGQKTHSHLVSSYNHGAGIFTYKTGWFSSHRVAYNVGPPSWFINPRDYNYKYNKPWLLQLCSPT